VLDDAVKVNVSRSASDVVCKLMDGRNLECRRVLRIEGLALDDCLGNPEACTW
jgi:hypothetical protein